MERKRSPVTIYDPRTGTWGHWVTLTDRDRYLHVFISEKGKHRHHRSRSENPYSQYTLAELEEAIRLLEETIAGYEAEVKAFKADKSMAEVPSIITRVQKIGGIRPPRRGQAFYVEWKESVPAKIKRRVSKPRGKPIDVAADELGMSAAKLIQRLADAATAPKLDKEWIKHYGEPPNKQEISELRRELRKLRAAARRAS